MNCGRAKIFASGALPWLCALGLIMAVFCTPGASANATPARQSDPNTPLAPGSAQTPLEAEIPEPNVPDVNVPDANVPDANAPGNPTTDQTQQQPQTVQAAEVTQKPVAPESTANMRNLRRASIIAEVDPNDDGKAQLERLIAQINSMTFGKLDAEFNTKSGSKATASTEPNKPVVTPKPQKKTAPVIEQVSKPATSSAGLLTPETLGIFGKQMQTPQDVVEPFELAEILYSSGHLAEAAAAYQQALSGMDPNDSGTANKRAWTLSQIGNCLRHTKPQEAMQNYQQLINDYPASPWTEFAAAMNSVLGWLGQDKPRDLMAEVRKLKADSLN